jgi:hypothetical protein
MNGSVRGRAGKLAGWAIVVLIGLLLVAAVVAAFGPLPGRVLGPTTGLSAADRVKAESDVRGTLLQAVAGVLLVIAAVTAWRQMLISRSQHALSRRIAVTDAFTKGVEQLGRADSLATRLGGVYSLDRIADDDPTERTRIAEILSAFVRDTTQGAESLPKDTVAALKVLTRRDWPQGVDLAGSQLAGARLPGAHLTASRLAGVNLNGAILTGAGLRSADLSGADLRRADLAGADLRTARLDGARLSGATADRATRWPENFDPAAHGVLKR